MTEPSDRKVADLGESGLIARIVDKIGSARGGALGLGDDTAVVPVGTERVPMTTDELAEGLDFDFSYCARSRWRWKAIAVNASDIAAMCGEPLWATVSLGVPPDTQVSKIDGVLEGMVEAAACWDVGIVGGDTSRAAEISLAVTMLGSLVGPAAGDAKRSSAGGRLVCHRLARGGCCRIAFAPPSGRGERSLRGSSLRSLACLRCSDGWLGGAASCAHKPALNKPQCCQHWDLLR